MFSTDWKAADLKELTRQVLLKAGQDQILGEVISDEADRLLSAPTPQVVEIMEEHSSMADRTHSTTGTQGKIQGVREVIAGMGMKEVVENFLLNGKLPFDREAGVAKKIRLEAGGNPQDKDELLISRGKKYFLKLMQIPEQSFDDLSLATFLQEWERCNALRNMGAIKPKEMMPKIRLLFKARMEEPDTALRAHRFDYEQERLKELEAQREQFRSTGIRPDMGKFL